MRVATTDQKADYHLPSLAPVALVRLEGAADLLAIKWKGWKSPVLFRTICNQENPIFGWKFASTDPTVSERVIKFVRPRCSEGQLSISGIQSIPPVDRGIIIII